MNSLSVENQAWLPSHGRLCLALQFSRGLLAAKYPFLCGCFFGLRRSSFLPFWTGPPGKGMNKCWTRSGQGKSGRHSSYGRFVMLAGSVWKWLHLTIWTPSWELKQTQTKHLLDALIAIQLELFDATILFPTLFLSGTYLGIELPCLRC